VRPDAAGTAEDVSSEEGSDVEAAPAAAMLDRIRAAAMAHAPPTLQRKLRAREESKAAKAAGDEESDTSDAESEAESEQESGSGSEAEGADDIDLDTVDDAELMKIDEGLARMFGEMRRGRTEAKGVLLLFVILVGQWETCRSLRLMVRGNGVDTARQQQHFRLRVLDLIEVFVRTQSENPLMYESSPSLCQLSRPHRALLQL
jgi:hypothetical protein